MPIQELASIWNQIPQYINPIAFSIGIFSIRWYSLMYLVAFATVYILIKRRITKKEDQKLSGLKLDELFLYLILGLLVGGRVGYIMIYQAGELFSDPIGVFSPFRSGEFVGYYGVSYHGGLIGIIIAALLFCKKNKLSFVDLSDFVIPAIPLGYFFGRIGNFLNGELFGRVTSSKIGMYFPLDETNSLRHPSQLYEAFFEGLVIFILLWSNRNNPKLKKGFLPLYLFLYAATRFAIEFFRQPDQHLGFVLIGLTMGQLLSLAMIVAAIAIWKMEKIFTINKK